MKKSFYIFKTDTNQLIEKDNFKDFDYLAKENNYSIGIHFNQSLTNFDNKKLEIQ